MQIIQIQAKLEVVFNHTINLYISELVLLLAVEDIFVLFLAVEDISDNKGSPRLTGYNGPTGGLSTVQTVSIAVGTSLGTLGACLLGCEIARW